MYSVWLNDRMIGETAFDLPKLGRRKLAGRFHPTEFGLTVLPSITAMLPALFDFGDLCRNHGLPRDTDPGRAADEGFDLLAETPAGRRLQAAAHVIAQLEIRDDEGYEIVWESILISDSADLVAIAARLPHEEAEESEASLSEREAYVNAVERPNDPIRY